MSEIVKPQEQPDGQTEVLRTIPELAQGIEGIVRKHGHSADIVLEGINWQSLTSHPEWPIDWQALVDPKQFKAGFHIHNDQIERFMFCGEPVFCRVKNQGQYLEEGDFIDHDNPKMTGLSQPFFGKLLQITMQHRFPGKRDLRSVSPTDIALFYELDIDGTRRLGLLNVAVKLSDIYCLKFKRKAS